MRHLRAPVALLFFISCAPAFAYDVRVLSHPAGTPTTTSDGRSFVSSAVAGTYAPASCFSADGRFVTFASWGSDLVAGQVNGSYIAVYLTDLSTGVTSIVSHDVASLTTTANGVSSVPVISADGRWVAYWGTSTNLVAGTTGGIDNVFLYDRLTGVNTLVSHLPGDPLTGGNGDSFAAFVSADGQFVVFLSKATNLVPSQVLNHDPAGTDVFLFNRDSGGIVLVSHSAESLSRTGNGASIQYVSSADGRFVAYTSLATDLVNFESDSNSNFDVYLFDRVTGTTSLVSRSAGAPALTGNGLSFEPSISADGRFVAYESYADDLIRHGRRERRVSRHLPVRSRLRKQPAREPFSDLVEHDGRQRLPPASDQRRRERRGVHESRNRARPVPDGSERNELRRVRLRPPVRSHDAREPECAVAATQTGNGESLNPVISADGSRIAFESRATDLVSGQFDTNNAIDVFVFDRISGKTALVSRKPSAPGAAGSAASTGPLLSADGNLVAFNSDATDLGSSDTNNSVDAFIYSAASFGSTLSFLPLTPCRLVDTRTGPTGGPALAASSTRDFTVTGACGVPSDAASLSLNVTVTQAAASGFVDVFPAGLAAPHTAIVSFRPGQTRGNNATVALGGTPAGTLTVRNASAGSVDVILDVNGFFR